MKKIIIFLSLVSITLVVLFIHGVVSTDTLTQDGKTFHRIGKVNGYTVYEHNELCSLDDERDIIQEDEFFIYYFSCPLSSNYLFKTNGDLITLEEVLKDQNVLIDDLREVITSIRKQPRYDLTNENLKQPVHFKIENYDLIGDVGDYLLYIDKNANIPYMSEIDLEQAELFYKDETGSYYFYDEYSHYYLVVKDDDVTYLPNALILGKITPEDLEAHREQLRYWVIED
ncbi:hypothetical protein [Haloplasma contractile]|uniref:Uncharacterized protein n=1 Tax=Haloplasma contractile SSD-17B TaxID=1033810 RepID=F7PU36_9MOLU|nr:hypothetical protein [Haloplasma contractile]ERJ11787.1 hypothetical protein HLPCO_002270 [Haloplasma contractile SSD-17B]